MVKQLLYSTVHRLINWLTRRRSVGIALMRYSIPLILIPPAADLLVQFDYKSGRYNIDFGLATGQGFPQWVIFGLCGLGVAGFVLGLVIVAVERLRDFKRERRQRLIVVELRGLNTGPDTPAKDTVQPEFIGHRLGVLADFRPCLQGGLVDPQLLLERVGGIRPAVESLIAGCDKSDVHLAVGGLAAVPALFLAGMVVDDESHASLFDWDRNLKNWRAIEGPDDGDRFLPLEGLQQAGNFKEVVLVVAASYAIAAQDIAGSFDPSLPVLKLSVAEPKADRFWSEDKQRALATSFRDAVQVLLAKGAKRIHLVLAAPASLSVRLGMAYDKRLYPEIVVYQFERTSVPPYPWGIQMPTHGKSQPAVVYSPAVQELML